MAKFWPLVTIPFGIQEGLSAIGKMQKEITEFMGLNPVDISAEFKLSYGIEVTLIQIFNLYFLNKQLWISKQIMCFTIGLKTYAILSSGCLPAKAQASAV